MRVWVRSTETRKSCLLTRHYAVDLQYCHIYRKIFDMLEKLFDLLQKSTIAHRETADPRQRFWKTYRTVAEAFDNELLARYGGDMDVSMIFVRDVVQALSNHVLIKSTRLVSFLPSAQRFSR